MNGVVRQQGSIVLIGLSGSGKSTVGRYLATRLNYPLHDTDAIIEAETGQSAADIFASRGEVAFRALESAVLRRVLATPPAVIATAATDACATGRWLAGTSMLRLSALSAAAVTGASIVS